jgi:hypothetical protein
LSRIGGFPHDIKTEGIVRVLVKFSAVPGVRLELVFIPPSSEIGKGMALTIPNVNHTP